MDEEDHDDNNDDDKSNLNLIPTTFRRRSTSIGGDQGPDSLLVLCEWFRELVFSHESKYNNSVHVDSLQELLHDLCINVQTLDAPFLSQSDQSLIQLPPKQFVLWFQEHFFQNADHITDIFVKSSYLLALEDLYGREESLDSSDESWAVCFQTIVLLSLGPDLLSPSSHPLIAPEFLLSYHSMVQQWLNKTQNVLVPRLINIQVLILLSVAARQHFPLGFAETMLSQACVLAKTMGLHHVSSYPQQDGDQDPEIQERLKVFRSLYVQDKDFALLRGSVCWLP
ncbi:hypothetical protein N7462_009398 [Penicillium macrosclerotiorum]|uniref:uncharacterized protein n=1 Tax=Penicillium macrosclerotiorum TaxID=303699 RepID=UPI002547176C|nr:uncharacterized protein N7462_009398 [Penicillium macrosclerotiorum]KAJ5673959.1 hypothetical protein N7462_009398 [Penicillium macrosclerotiorum]